MAGNQIVIRFIDGSVKKGHTNDFVPNKTSFHLNNADGKTEGVNLEGIKSIFFVKELNGNKEHKKNKIIFPAEAKRSRWNLMTVKL